MCFTKQYNITQQTAQETLSANRRSAEVQYKTKVKLNQIQQNRCIAFPESFIMKCRIDGGHL